MIYSILDKYFLVFFVCETPWNNSSTKKLNFRLEYQDEKFHIHKLYVWKVNSLILYILWLSKCVSGIKHVIQEKQEHQPWIPQWVVYSHVIIILPSSYATKKDTYLNNLFILNFNYVIKDISKHDKQNKC